MNLELRTLKLNCAKAKAMVLGRNKLIVIIFFGLFVDYGTQPGNLIPIDSRRGPIFREIR
jgi:hypothetical protein